MTTADKIRELIEEKEYYKVIREMTDFMDTVEKIPSDAYYLRGKAHYSLMHLNETLADLRMAVKTSKNGDVIASSNAKIYAICKNACDLECDPDKYFFTED